MKFGEILEIRNGKNQRKVENPNGKYPIYGSGGIMGWADDYICPANTVVIGRKGTINNPIYVETPFWNVDTAFGLVPDDKIILSKYLFYFCRSFNFNSLNTTVTIPSLTKASLSQIEVDVPPLEKQRATIKTLDVIENTLFLVKKQLAKLDTLIKSRFIEMFGDPVTNPMGWAIDTLDKHLEVIGGYAFKSSEFTDDGIPVLRIGNINSGSFQKTNMVYWVKDNALSRYEVRPGDLVISLTGTVGKSDYGNVCIMGNDYPLYYLNQRNAKLSLFSSLSSQYVAKVLKNEAIKRKLTDISRGIRQANIANSDILNLVIPIPPIALQNQFADFVQQVDKTKSVLQKLLEKQELLQAALMQEYFG